MLTPRTRYAEALRRAAATPATGMGELPSSTRLDQEMKQLRAQHYRDTGERLSFREAARQVGDRYAAERRQVQLGHFAETRQRVSDGAAIVRRARVVASERGLDWDSYHERRQALTAAAEEAARR